MTVYETDIPGVGRKFEIELGGGARLSIVVHHDGRCELFRRAGPDADGEKLLDLTSDQANKLGSILEGAYFESVDVDQLTVPLGEAFIEWVDLEEDSPLAGTTLAAADIRHRTGVSIIAVQRGEQTISNPDADTELRVGDILVGVGTREQQADFVKLAEPEA
ncbi:MAG: cation:proton antiporter regulatory subunit [Haloferacaceae archaeon]